MPTNVEVIQEIGKVSVAVARIEEHMIRQDELSIELAKVIKGNGKPGLISDVGCLRRDLDSHLLEVSKQNADKTAKKEKWDGRTWALFTSLLLFSLGQIASLIIK